MRTNSIDAYESRARDFLDRRDTSAVGVRTVSRWARSLKPNAEVIELACGGGIPVTKALLEAELKVWAIDSSQTLLAVFKERFPTIPVQCASALKSDYFERTYDAAICVGLIFLLPEEEQIALLNRVSEVLRPGASFLFTAPVEVGGWEDSNTGLPCISLGRDGYEGALAKAAFRIVRLHEDRGQNNYYEAVKLPGEPR